MSLFEYLLRMGDNALILSQRLGEWCGHGPALEEDIATTNVALDLLGEARMWLSYAGETEQHGRDEDTLALHRDSREFRNVLLVEQPNGPGHSLDFGDTIARQFLFDAWHHLALQHLADSRDGQIRAIAQKTFKESTYHLRRSSDWMIRLGDGTEESRARIQASVNALWMYTGELFERDSVDEEMAREKIGFDPSELVEPWMGTVRRVFSKATLDIPQHPWMQSGGKRGVHTEQLSYLLAEMQYLPKTYPGAQW